MTCAQFIKRLSGLNDGGNFPVDLLRRLYSAIKGNYSIEHISTNISHFHRCMHPKREHLQSNKIQ